MLWFIACLAPSWAATFIVTNINDSGAGSLRQAILDANAVSGLDNITFQIPGAGSHTISTLSVLPAITDPVFIDGTSQLGFAGAPIIEINGASAGNNAGLRLLAGNTTVRGLVINRCGAEGISVLGPPGTNVIAGNYIGADLSGTAARPNLLQGILINASSGNIVGGTTVADRNIVSGNGSAGIYLLNSSGNSVLGNFIGTTAAGTAPIGNTNNGITLVSSPGNTIGGTSAASRNVSSGNGGSGIYLSEPASSANVIQGNFFGTDSTGSSAIANAGDGVTFQDANGNLLGGSSAGAGNLISGNGEGGISFFSATNNVIQGNLIGVNSAGGAAVANQFAGITLVTSRSNTIGGVSDGALNVISGNKKDGVFMTTNSVGNVISGNYIGIDSTGTNALPNFFNGVTINNASQNTIGGVSAAARNVISGNLSFGIQISSGATGNQIQGNYIGTDSTGQKAIANHFSGIEIESASNAIGGALGGLGNLISGNSQDGVMVVGPNANNNSIQGNFVGTKADGSSALGNTGAGIGLSDAPGNLIGGNVISGNSAMGMYLFGTGVSGNQIVGNFIGTDKTGAAPLGNSRSGISVERAQTNTIGGTLISARNLISANGTWGIILTNASWTTIQGNYVGTAADGSSPLGNGNTLGGFHAIEIQAGGHDNVIGGNPAAAGNRIAFAPVLTGVNYAGIRIRDGSTNNLISRNAIFSNGGLGIDLGGYQVTQNDNCDVDPGANMLQNFPLLTQAVSGSGIGVRGILNSKANSTFNVQFFANAGCDSSGNGEGQTFLGEKIVTTDGSCNVSFVAQLPGTVPAGYIITATATDGANNTSEFSACVTVALAPVLSISSAASNQQVNLAWSTNVTGFVLKQTPSLSPPIQWTTVPSTLSNTQFVASYPVTSSNSFFALTFE